MSPETETNMFFKRKYKNISYLYENKARVATQMPKKTRFEKYLYDLKNKNENILLVGYSPQLGAPNQIYLEAPLKAKQTKNYTRCRTQNYGM